MKLHEATDILNNLPIGRSQFEFKNFFIDAYPSNARLFAAALIEFENLHISKMENLEKLSKESVSEADQIRINRQLNIIENQITQLTAYFDKINQEEMPDATEYENQESKYWRNILGKQAAVELLTTDRISTPTMNQMVNLPHLDFIESVKICIESIKLIKNFTDHLQIK